MNCVFLGHRDAPSLLKTELKTVILKLVDCGVEEFFVGNNGNFDALVQSALAEIKREGHDIKYSIVLSRIDEVSLSDQQKYTVFPECVDGALPKYGISKRNEWLIKKADIMVVYLKNKFSNTFKYASKAERKGAKIINLANTGGK